MKEWKDFEKKLARRTNGRRTPGSGNKYIKGDVLTDRYMIEAKQRTSDFYELSISDLEKLSFEAEAARKEPLFAVSLNSCELYLVPACQYLNLIKRYINVNKSIRLSADLLYTCIVFESMEWLVVEREDVIE